MDVSYLFLYFYLNIIYIYMIVFNLYIYYDKYVNIINECLILLELLNNKRNLLFYM